MTKRATAVFYVFMLALFAAGAGMILKTGKGIETQRGAASFTIPSLPSETASTVQAKPSAQHQFFLFFIQFAAVFAAAKVFGFLLNKLGQPEVMGEMIAGLALGPSLLGRFAPDFFHFLFPADSMGLLKFFSQAGVLVFMFLVGLELNLKSLKQKVHAAVLVSHAGILFPYFLGMLLSLFLYRSYAPAPVNFMSFSLFMGIALSITAFPVLARILEEKGLTCTPLGTMALTCAAADDVTAWAILAAVVAVAQSHSGFIFLKIAGLTGVFAWFMIYVLRPALQKILGNVKNTAVPWIVCGSVAAVSGWLTSLIGIHALFGVFLSGVICPELPVREKFKRTLGKAAKFLLPLFFVFTGLRTQTGLLSGSAGIICGLIIAAAILGKMGGTVAAARSSKMPWPEALSLGALMNTRGLMELIVLNIGYDMGILSQTMFAMLVMMALVTTLMAGPLLSLFGLFFVRPSCC